MSKHFSERTSCKVCGSDRLTDVFSLAPQFLSATFVEDNMAEAELASIKVPMTLCLCDSNSGCGLLQLREEVEGDLLYRRYFYRSSTNSTMVTDLRNVVDDVCSKVDLRKDDIVVDIGANDCTMVQFYPEHLNRVAVEPAQNINWDTVDKSITIINDYFNAKSFREKYQEQKVKIFSCCAMFYDLPDPNQFVSDIKELLDADGVWCIQLSYLPLMLENMNFYDICHEHLSYYSLTTLDYLMRKNGLFIFDASTNAVNGGSARVFITHQENTAISNDKTRANLKTLFAKEKAMALEELDTYTAYYKKINDLSYKIQKFFQTELERGNKIIGLGASTKGNILLQFFGITKEMMPYISEINEVKIGLRTLGSDFELVSEEFALSQKPSTYFVLPWYFKDEIIKREANFIAQGGSLLFPMPYAHLVTKDGETLL